MLVVDDHPFVAGGLVGAQVLVNAPVAAPPAQDAAAATAGAEEETERRQSNRRSDGAESVQVESRR